MTHIQKSRKGLINRAMLPTVDTLELVKKESGIDKSDVATCRQNGIDSHYVVAERDEGGTAAGLASGAGSSRVYDLFRRWQRDGTRHRILTRLQA
ncbi:hypothetical protein ABT223_43840 [Streptomyces sviceus]